MWWVFAFLVGYCVGHVPVHLLISRFKKQTCAPTVLANVTLKQYLFAGWVLGYLFVVPFMLWYLFYLISFDQQIACMAVMGFTVGNGLPLWKKYRPSLQIYPFVSLLFILSFKVAFASLIMAVITFMITRKVLKTRGYFVLVALLLFMLFPERLEGIFYILPVGVLLFIADYAMLLSSKERKWQF